MNFPLSASVRQAAEELLRTIEAIDRRLAAGDDPQSLQPGVDAAIDGCLTQLGELNLLGAANQLPSSQVWNAAGHLLSRGWLQERARNKPRGYAGDYEMLVRIYEYRRCEDPLGQLFDRYFQSQSAPQAVRNRMAMIADWIVNVANKSLRPLRLAIVGSAFGLEIRDALQRLDAASRAQISVSLVDVDPAALEFAEVQLRELLGDRLLTAATNLFRLPDRPKSAEILRGADWIFSPGLFDYLGDAAATAMVRTLYAQFAPGGRLTLFQFAPHNPTRAYMEWFGNWYLTYRDAESFSRLVKASVPSEAGIEFGSEPLGIDLYATVQRQ